jgi:hypothetical protein
MADGSTIKVEKGIVTQILVMEAEVPDAPVDVTALQLKLSVDEVEVQNVDVDDAIIVELSNKVIELQAIIDSLMSAEQSEC